MKYLILILSVILLAASQLSADIVYLRDGTNREGTIVSDTADVVVLEVYSGGTAARVTIRKDDIDRIEKKATDRDKLLDEYRKKLRELDSTSADATAELGRWCISKKLYKEAEDLFNKLVAKGGDDAVRGNVELAKMEQDRGRPEVARKYLNVVLEKNPDQPDARALMAALKDDERKAVARLLSDAVDRYERRSYDEALKKAEDFHDRATLELTDKLIPETIFPDNMKFEEFVAESRLRRPCKSCKDGAEACPVCKGKDTVGDRILCGECGGAGTVVCSKCDGTNVRFDAVPDWEQPAVARGLEKRYNDEQKELQTLKEKLASKPDTDALMPAAFKTIRTTWRASRWLSELAKLADKRPTLTTIPVAAEREGLMKGLREMMAGLGKTYQAKAQKDWEKLLASDEGMLAQDAFVRDARNDGARAMFFYNQTKDNPKKYPNDVKDDVAALNPALKKMDEVIDHDAKLVKAYDLMIKAARANELRATLDIATQIVQNASKLDLVYLSNKVAKELKYNLADMMAACRFELGKDKGDFGEPIDYEKPAFMKKLLMEADGAAKQADANYQQMKGMADIGQRQSVTTTMVRDTRELARNAERWYKASRKVKYPMSADKLKFIEDQVRAMGTIISGCNHWFDRLPGPGP